MPYAVTCRRPSRQEGQSLNSRAQWMTTDHLIPDRALPVGMKPALLEVTPCQVQQRCRAAARSLLLQLAVLFVADT